MTNTQWVVGLAGAACLIAATVLSGLADDGHGRMMQGGHDQGERDEHSGHYLKHPLKHAKEIGLTQEQIGKLKTMQLDFKRMQVKKEADVKIAEFELHALCDEEQAELSTIEARVDHLKNAEGALLLAGIKARRDAMALLTPEQREKDRAQREKMKSEQDHRGGMGGMGRGGMGERRTEQAWRGRGWRTWRR